MGAGGHPCIRATQQPAGRVRIGCWQVDLETREVVSGDITRRISPKASAVLVALIAADGRVVSRDALMDAVWPDVTVGEESLTHAVSELRRALRDASGGPSLIDTVHKAGYRLLAEAIPQRDLDPVTDYLIPPGDDFDLDAYLLCLDARQVLERSGAGAVQRSLEICAEAAARAPWLRIRPGGIRGGDRQSPPLQRSIGTVPGGRRRSGRDRCAPAAGSGAEPCGAGIRPVCPRQLRAGPARLSGRAVTGYRELRVPLPVRTRRIQRRRDGGRGSAGGAGGAAPAG